ncbi:YidC/Oxa1 family membrane protein insertase [Micromonospora sp. WMMA1923]|uniref:YidC/Oxa1 family membrane protein insertase n=1 Tax=Micromonospora sp. WMMA1923 TaxID=3404125 RepID=UPI003B92C4E0
MLAFAPVDTAVGAASAAVHLLAATLEPLTGGAATAVAIVLFTVLVRLLVSPLTVAQVRGERRRAALAPRVRDLRQRYADDPARQQRELLGLYREAGASPVAGCLPALLQAPFFFLMFQLFTTADAGRGLLTEELAGVSLGHRVGDGLAGAAGPLFGVLLVVLTALAWWSSRRMRRATAGGSAVATGSAVAGGSAVATGSAGGGLPPAGESVAEVGGAVAVVLGRLLPLLPYLTVAAALVLPLAGVLYLVTTTAWTALEQLVFRRSPAVPIA